MSPPKNVSRTFYERLNEIREYHRCYPSNDVTEAENDEEALKYEPQVEFSGEEVYGKYLDLHECYNIFINKKFGDQIDYSEYLSNLLLFEKIQRTAKLGVQYRWGTSDLPCGKNGAGSTWTSYWPISSRSTIEHTPLSPSRDYTPRSGQFQGIPG